MTILVRIIIIGGIGILAYRAIAASAAGALGFEYTRFIIGSYVICAITGYVAGKRGPLWWGAVTGAAVAAVEVIAGWRLAAAVSPAAARQVIEEARAARSWTELVLLVMLVGSALGLGGAVYAWWRNGRFGRYEPLTGAERRA